MKDSEVRYLFERLSQDRRLASILRNESEQESSLIPMENRKSSFESFLTSSTLEAEIKEKVQTFLRNSHPSTGLFLYGKSGRGKTHLAHAAFQSCQKSGKNVLFISYRDFINNPKKAEELISYDAELYILDDFNDFSSSFSFFIEQIFEKGKKVIITSNLSDDEFLRRVCTKVTQRLEARFNNMFCRICFDTLEDKRTSRTP